MKKKLKLKGKQHKESRQLKKKKIPSYGNFMRLWPKNMRKKAPTDSKFMERGIAPPPDGDFCNIFFNLRDP